MNRTGPRGASRRQPSRTSNKPSDSAEAADNGEKEGVQTVATVAQVFRAFLGADLPSPLTVLAERADMHPAKMHRYLVSLSKSNYVRQDSDTGWYRLGPASLHLGQAAVDANPVVLVARPILRELRDLRDCSAFIALWTEHGPIIALQEMAHVSATMAARVGSILPLLRSSTGRTFAAWLPKSATGHIVESEIAALRVKPVMDCPRTMREADSLLDDVRQRRLAVATGILSAAVHGLSAPVFDSDGNLCAVISIFGEAGQFDTRLRGPSALALNNAVKDVMAALRDI